MRQVCRECKYSKPFNNDYCKCVKYGCPIRYGREFCISYEPEEVRKSESRFGWSYVRQQEGSEQVGGAETDGEGG